jgi:hypothetical protein
MGLSGFATVVFIGLLAGNDPVTTLGRGLICMVICNLVGRLLGHMGARSAAEFIERYKVEHPVPQPPAELVRLQGRRDRHKEIVEEMKRAA